MQRITTLLKESEADAVRNAVCIGGGKMIVITPVPRSHDTWQWRDGQGAAQREDFVRLEVMSDECHSNGVISAIKKTSNSGKIILVFNQDRGLNQAS